MPDKRSHRGAHPQDEELFSEKHLPAMRTAAGDYCWLLSRDYPSTSALKLIGDKHAFTQRQRLAIGRYACSNSQLQHRSGNHIPRDQLAGQTVWIDGYNLLTTIEAALGGGVILPGRDGSTRDMASMHGTYRKVAETLPALQLIGETLTELGIAETVWYLDRPVSNSGRLKTILREFAEKHDWNWQAELVNDPDAVLKETAHPCITADSEILDCCQHWVNLASWIVTEKIPTVWVVDLSETNAG